jgi:cysteine-rich repeat protein
MDFRRIAGAFGLVAGLQAGCTDDAVTPEGSESDGGTTTGAAATGADTGPSTGGTGMTFGPGPTDSGADSTDTGFDPPTPACGNGFIEDGEQCDDANAVDDDDCTNTCLVPCGLDWSVVTPAPTIDSDAIGLSVAGGSDGTVATAAFIRERIADKRGNVTVLDDVVQVDSYDAAGRPGWTRTLTSPDGGVSVGAVAVADDGMVVAATTVPEVTGGSQIEVHALAASDGGDLWSVLVPGIAGEDDLATGAAVAPDGDVVVSGRVRVGDGDNDAWVRKLAAGDGSEVWTTTYSGAFNNGFSVDMGGPVAVAATGEVYVLMAEYVDFETRQGRLLAISADGGDPVWTFAPQLGGSGQAKQHTPVDVVAADDGGVVFAIERTVGAQIDFHVFRLDASGNEEWSMDRAALEAKMGADFTLRGVAPLPGGVGLVGRYVNDFEIFDSAWGEIWLARLDHTGALQCRLGFQATGRGLLPPSLSPRAAGSGPAAGLLVTGELALDGESSVWLGRFRP